MSVETIQFYDLIHFPWKYIVNKLSKTNLIPKVIYMASRNIKNYMINIPINVSDDTF